MIVIRWMAAGPRAGSFGDRSLVCLPVFQTIPNVSNRQLISGSNPPDLHPLAVDSDAVGASQVADHHFAVFVRHAAVMSRNAKRIKTCIARWVTTHNHHGTVQVDVWTFIEGHKSCGHGKILDPSNWRR